MSERDYRVLTVGLALCAGLAVAYAVVFPGPIPLSSTVIRDAIVFVILAIVADEMSVEISDRVTLAACNLPILLAIMFTGRLPAIGVAVAVGLWGAWRESSRLSWSSTRRTSSSRCLSLPLHSTPCSVRSESILTR